MQKILNKLVLLMLIVFSMFCLCSTTLPVNVYADTGTSSTYTEVLEDLTKDSSFKLSNYPVNEYDNSISLIHIAESNNKELFVYVYQPNSPNTELQATSINISTGIKENLSYINYKLKLVDFCSTLYKYKVNNFNVLNDTTRYYDITSIYRAYISGVDSPAVGDNTISEVPFEVAKQYTFTTTSSGTSITCKDIETITITDKYVGFCRYYDGLQINYPYLVWATNASGYSTDSWYVAFSTNRQIDNLLEADVFYSTQNFSATVNIDVLGNASLVYRYSGEVVPQDPVTIYPQEVSNAGSYLFGVPHTWNRIETTDHFVANENLTDETKVNLQGTTWVLRFVETYSTANVDPKFLSTDVTYTGTAVSDVTILRLKFETNGDVYNLGTIDNKQTGLKMSNPSKHFDLFDIIGLILGIILLVVLAPILPYIIKFVWFIISAPFKLIFGLFRKNKKDNVVVDVYLNNKKIKPSKKGRRK